MQITLQRKKTTTNKRNNGLKKEGRKKEEKEKLEIKEKGKKHGKEKIAILSRFHNTLKKTITKCVICFEAWPMLKSSSNFTCRRCKSDKKVPKKFSLENNMIPSAVPACLSGLTQRNVNFSCTSNYASLYKTKRWSVKL